MTDRQSRPLTHTAWLVVLLLLPVALLSVVRVFLIRPVHSRKRVGAKQFATCVVPPHGDRSAGVVEICQKCPLSRVIFYLSSFLPFLILK